MLLNTGLKIKAFDFFLLLKTQILKTQKAKAR